MISPAFQFFCFYGVESVAIIKRIFLSHIQVQTKLLIGISFVSTFRPAKVIVLRPISMRGFVSFLHCENVYRR